MDLIGSTHVGMIFDKITRIPSSWVACKIKLKLNKLIKNIKLKFQQHCWKKCHSSAIKKKTTKVSSLPLKYGSVQPKTVKRVQSAEKPEINHSWLTLFISTRSQLHIFMPEYVHIRHSREILIFFLLHETAKTLTKDNFFVQTVNRVQLTAIINCLFRFSLLEISAKKCFKRNSRFFVP